MSILLSLDSSTLNTDSTSDFTVGYNTPINLGKERWELSLVKANLWYSWYNISQAKGNNIIRYTGGAVSPTDVVIPDGQYTIDQINSYLHDQMDIAGDYITISGNKVYGVSLEPNYSTLRTKISLDTGYSLDLSVGTLYLLLGGDPVNITTSGDLSYVANINDSINSLVIHCSLVTGLNSYNNSNRSDVIYTFVPSNAPGTNIDISPVQKIYLPVNVVNNQITEIRMRITDNLGRPIDLNGEPVTYLLHMRLI